MGQDEHRNRESRYTEVSEYGTNKVSTDKTNKIVSKGMSTGRQKPGCWRDPKIGRREGVWTPQTKRDTQGDSNRKKLKDSLGKYLGNLPTT